ncbi:MAG: N-acetylglucosamine-6-phosphate deacetylase [Planctomycetota bacterium]
MSLLLKDATCVTPGRTVEDRTLVLKDGTIARIAGSGYQPGCEAEVMDVDGNHVLPSFIDMHAHGCLGADFSDPDFPIRDGVDFLHAHGVTALYPTLHARPWQEMKASLERGGELCSRGAGSALFRALHCEGPFLNPEMSGAAPVEALRRPTLEAWNELQNASGGRIRVLTIAPELEGASQVVRAAYHQGTVVSAGHSNADYDTVMSAVDEGLREVTHLFNAMAHFHHRDPNILLAALLEPDIRVQINADGGHVHPRGMQMAYRLKGPQGIIITSDLHPAGGLPPGTHEWEGEKVENDGCLVRTADGTVAGSALPLDQGLRTMVREVGASLAEAARMASLNPAQELGLSDRKGRVAEGYDADLAVLDENLQVTATIADGRIVYRRDTCP